MGRSSTYIRNRYVHVAFNPVHWLLGFVLGVAVVGVVAWFLGPMLIGLALVVGASKAVAG